MGNRPTTRFVNGVIALVITVAFLAHAALGGLSPLLRLSSSLAWVVWGAVALAGLHVVASIVTSVLQLSDADRPPSSRKKRHLALKWATGALLAATAVAHVICVQTYGPDAAQVTATGAVAAIVLVAALAAHACVGAKSLLVDLGLNKRYMNAFRIALIAATALVAVLVMVGFAR